MKNGIKPLFQGLHKCSVKVNQDKVENMTPHSDPQILWFNSTNKLTDKKKTISSNNTTGSFWSKINNEFNMSCFPCIINNLNHKTLFAFKILFKEVYEENNLLNYEY
ncbi:hypothetical protein XELAEV_18004833mg [Xenopus laevis]|uniref:Uncharacterized protein n=1 Tax=Xenopus laevis TaxID=8355 RepID=A0A974I2K9_XENLA|nr:hypothetical protein XELAEV_18004833mg [Xenopus laevis]